MKGKPMAYKNELVMAAMFKQIARHLEKETHPQQGMTYEDAFWAVYWDRLSENASSDKQEAQHLKIIEIIGKDKLLREINGQTLSHIKRVLTGGGKSEATCNRYFSLMRTVFNHIKDTRVEDLVLHALRHSAVTRLLELGIPLPVVQEFVGHANINTTRRYIHLNHSHLVLAAEALDKL